MLRSRRIISIKDNKGAAGVTIVKTGARYFVGNLEISRGVLFNDGVNRVIYGAQPPEAAGGLMGGMPREP
jgi:hypothetical protein